MKSNVSKLLLMVSVLTATILLSCSRQEPPLPTAPPPPPPAPAAMNEIYSRGTTTAPDWIEIFNPSSTQMNIAGYKVYDIGGQSGAKPKRTFPAGAVVPARGFFVLVVDDTTASGFGLSSSGETVWFENAAGAIIDSVTFPALGIDTSYARKPDGTGSWTKTTPPTKDSTNLKGALILPIVMNEIYSRGTPDAPDWIEMYNPSNVSLDLGGYKIYDVGGQSGTKPKKAFPAGSIITASGFFVIVTDDTSASGFGLSSTGETVWLENAAGAGIDTVVFPAMPLTTQSYGRYPDGSAAWRLADTTRGRANRP